MMNRIQFHVFILTLVLTFGVALIARDDRFGLDARTKFIFYDQKYKFNFIKLFITKMAF